MIQLHIEKIYLVIPALQVNQFQGRSYIKSKIQNTHLWNRLNACEKGTYTNSVDPDERPQNAASQQGLCCLPRYKHTLGNHGRL